MSLNGAKAILKIQWVQIIPSWDEEKSNEQVIAGGPEKQVSRLQMTLDDIVLATEKRKCPYVDVWLNGGKFDEEPTFILSDEEPGDELRCPPMDDLLENGVYNFSNAPTFILMKGGHSAECERKISLLQNELGITL